MAGQLPPLDGEALAATPPPSSSKTRSIAFVFGLLSATVLVVGAVTLLGQKYSWSIGDLKNLTTMSGIVMTVVGGVICAICILIFVKAKEKQQPLLKTLFRDADVFQRKALENGPYPWELLTWSSVVSAIELFRGDIQLENGKGRRSTFIPCPGKEGFYLEVTIEQEMVWIGKSRVTLDINRDNLEKFEKSWQRIAITGDAVAERVQEQSQDGLIFMNMYWLMSLGYNWDLKHTLPNLSEQDGYTFRYLIPKHKNLSLEAMKVEKQGLAFSILIVQPGENK